MFETARRLRNTAAGLRIGGLFAQPGHFGSPIPGRVDTLNGRSWAKGVRELPGVALCPERQVALFRELGPMLAEVPQDRRYTRHAPNTMFPLSDAALLSGLMRHFQPARFVEVGSGFSSAEALDTADRWDLPTRFTFIEPFPQQRLERMLTEADRERVDVRREFVQDTPLATFEQLDAGDMLFIDSSHMAKTGSDVLRLVLRIVPALQPGVLVHIHDMFWPFEYPAEWLEEGRAWNEAYLVHAFLLHNSAWQILLFGDWLWRAHPDLVEAFIPDASTDRPGSLWLQRVAPGER
jgi:predicted O-methyltransferase YrrM